MQRKPGNQVKGQPTEQEKIFANSVSDKELIQNISRVYNELKKLDRKKSNNPINKQVDEINGHFSNGETRMANKHKKTHPTSLIIKEKRIETRKGDSNYIEILLLFLSEIKGPYGNLPQQKCLKIQIYTKEI